MLTYYHPHKLIIICSLFFLSFFLLTYSQNHKIISIGIENTKKYFNKDSSIYNIVNYENNYILLGEKGYLKLYHNDTIKDLFTLCKQQYNYKLHGDLIKAIQINHSIFIITNKSSIIKINMKQLSMRIHKIKELKNKAIYDFILYNNELFLVGGNHKISIGKVGVPKGYIAKIDTGLNKTTIIKKYFSKFIWHINLFKKDTFLFSSFNGIKSTIYSYTPANNHITPVYSTNGLIYKIYPQNDTLLFIGSNSIFYRKNGLFGITSKNGHKKIKIKNSGCLWDIIPDKNKKIFLLTSQNGDIFKLNILTLQLNRMNINLTTFPIYQILNENQKYLIVGHNKLFAIID